MIDRMGKGTEKGCEAIKQEREKDHKEGSSTDRGSSLASVPVHAGPRTMSKWFLYLAPQ